MQKASIKTRMNTPPDEAIRMILSVLKKGRGGVMGGRVCVTSVTDEPLIGSAGGAMEGRATTDNVVVTELSMETVGGAMDGRATIEVAVVTVWPEVKGRGMLVEIRPIAAVTDSTFICDEFDERVWLIEAVVEG